MEDEKLYQVALELVPGIGSVHSKNLISYCGSAKAVFEAKKPHLLKIPGIGGKVINALKSQSVLTESEQILKKCEKSNIQISYYTDSAYPNRLKQIADCPNILYLKGEGTLNPDRTIAIVGTRNATPYGKEVTENIAIACGTLKATIVSGLAYGIDIHAHRAGLAADVPNIAVLAGGLNKIYPSVHKKTAENILEKGLLISENAPDVQAEAHFFPARNRIIAGISDATIVVEAAIKGGALITANIADSYDKPVFAVPGDLEHKYSEGCNYLIRNQKAYIYTGPEDIIYHLNWDLESSAPKKQKRNFDHLSEEERRVCEVLAANEAGIAIDDIAWKSQITINRAASVLIILEFQGAVKSLPGKRYQLI
ncbi:MAG: DNA processing protein [Cyclobacteriaceae bacterium]|jgi:DNA processing protein